MTWTLFMQNVSRFKVTKAQKEFFKPNLCLICKTDLNRLMPESPCFFPCFLASFLWFVDDVISPLALQVNKYLGWRTWLFYTKDGLFILMGVFRLKIWQLSIFSWSVLFDTNMCLSRKIIDLQEKRTLLATGNRGKSSKKWLM